ncbi:Ubiquitinyl hydrolase 1 [Purpureocillium takamizusanense]|uniref:Ubiquitinyl hydrolase 1 n=1 Tax=Purpureocillium takamizusanense TaxID=2060973 RepID=A0A9Q8VDS1_9HYPO|nr:Ubiquitinyl hydrolase 1 [Purpureocillium takamizusanense]UNI21501.1 Ubiquitinyl hydrolase 1 [Purpureocillium takamizusanense]
MAPDSPPSTFAPELPEVASSPEHPSTRPNPFDDGDVSSRKRRRTSASGSPAASLDTANPVHDASSSTTLEGDQSWSGSTMAMDEKPTIPRTPEQRQASPEPPPSRVTINLRRRSESGSPPESPTSLEPTHSGIDPTLPDAAEIRENARNSDAETTEELPAESGSTPSSRPGTSPAVEVIQITESEEAYSGNDQDMEISAAISGTSAVDDTLLIADPTPQFPYRQPSERLSATVQRLTDYLSSNKIVDGHVFDDIVTWLNDYLQFAKQKGAIVVLESRLINRDFWQSFPQIIVCLLPRRWELLKHPVLRNRLLSLYTAFTRLIAHNIALDTIALQSISSADGASAPAIFAPAYIQQLRNTVSSIDYQPDQMNEPVSEPGWNPINLELYLFRILHDSTAGCAESLAQLVDALAGAVSRWPKLADHLAPLSLALTDYTRAALRGLNESQNEDKRANGDLAVCHQMMETMSTALMAVIDKHIASLSPDCASTAIQCLAEVLPMSLRSDNQQAKDRFTKHRARYPTLVLKTVYEAIAWDWKVDALEKLVRSSQMNMRMAGVTTLCTHLVSLWKRFNDGVEDCSVDVVEHLAEYLLHIGLVDYILGGSCHPEIIIECANVIGFLVVTKTYRAEHSDMIWHGLTSSQDPRVVDALRRVLTTISALFDQAELLHICKRFQSLPLEHFTVSVRTALDNILGEMMRRCNGDHSTLPYYPYVLCLRLLRESSAISHESQIADQEVQRLAMQKFKELLGYGPDAEGRAQLYQSCIHDIASKSTTTLGSLWCLSMAIRNTTVTQMQVLAEHHDLARLIVEELEHAELADRSGAGCAVFSGTINHPRREFVTNLIQLQPGSIDNDLGARLWNLLVGSGSACPDDRRAGWHIILSVSRRTSFRNTFLDTCFTSLLPKLPTEYLCDGVLEFIKEKLQCFSNEGGTLLDDETHVVQTAIEQLWRLILEADDSTLVNQAIATLALGVYLEGCSVAGHPLPHARRMHLALVGRCLNQLKGAADTLKRSVDGSPSSDGDSMIIVLSETETARQERVFTRSLQLLRFFLKKYQSKPNFAVADLRSYMSRTPDPVEGDSAQLKYQSFDGDEQTDIMPLNIGKLNTVSSLLATLREETGFDNYRAYYRGRQLLPAEGDSCKSLQELDIQDGFIIVKREENYSSSPVRIKPGSLPLEVEVLAHFEELWDYLSMEERIAEEIYDFVVNIPADGYIMSQFDSDSTSSYRELFLPGQPFKSLYAIHALTEYVESPRRTTAAAPPAQSPESNATFKVHDEVLHRSLRLIIQALSDPSVLVGTTTRLKMRVASALMQTFVKLTQGTHRCIASEAVCNPVNGPAPKRLFELLYNALECQGDAGLPLIASTCVAILRLGQSDQNFWANMAQEPAFHDLIQTLVLYDPRRAVRMTAVELLENFVDADAPPYDDNEDRATSSEDPAVHGLAQYLWPVVSELIRDAVQLPDQCHELFKLLKKLLVHLGGQIDLGRLASQISRLLLEHGTTEHMSDQDPHDPVIAGLAALLLLCLNEDSALVASAIWPEKFIRHLFTRHLFPERVKEGSLSVSRIVLNTDTRAKLYEIIYRFASQDCDELHEVLDLLNQLVPFFEDDNDEPYLYDLPQQFDRFKALRAPCGYAGLRNLSNTCYLNALLTQLYMNPSFRQFILSVNTEDPSDTQELLFHTQNVFGYLQESYRRYVDPITFVSAIKTYDDTMIDIYNQMDVDEFYNLLFDRWEGQFPLAEDRKQLRSFYGGQLVQQVKSKECEHISERLEPFSAIQCDIKGNGTLEESLQAYVGGEVMDGDNKYKCSTCDRHVAAVKRACLKDVPDNVIFHLKRFDFNLRTLQRSKINDRFSFPRKIDLRPYTMEHLSNPDAAAEEDIFELVGVLVHTGTAESGHYYSYVRERPCTPGVDSWVEFNDDIVTPWDPSHLANATFGGPDHRAAFDGNGIIYDKAYSAYMLFYQRSSSLEAQQSVMTTQNLSTPLRVEVPGPLQEHIVAENTVILKRHCLFDPSHTMFVHSCFARGKQMERQFASLEDRGHELQSLAVEVALSHLDQIVSRTKDTPFFVPYSKTLQDAVSDCPKCALELIEYFLLRHSAYRALIQRSPEQHVRAFAGEIMIRAVKKIAEELPQVYNGDSHHVIDAASIADGLDPDDMSRHSSLAPDGDVARQPVLRGMVTLLNYLWQFFHLHLRSWDEVFGTMLAFSKLGPREAVALLSEDFLERLLRIITADTSSHLAANYARMLTAILRRGNRAPSYSAIICLIDHLMSQLHPTFGAEFIIEDASDRLDQETPVPWTSEEVQIIHDEPVGRVGSLFVEKVLSIDQAREATRSIVSRLTTMGSYMEVKVLETLSRNTQIDSVNPHFEAFLKGAERYIESTRATKHVELLIRHICDQARKSQNYEGAALLSFMRFAMRSQQPDEAAAEARRLYCRDLIPSWAPYLLVYPDTDTRHDAEQLIEKEIFEQRFARASAGDEDTGELDNTESLIAVESLDEVMHQLATQCLVYLREAHIKRRVRIERQAAYCILRVVGKCAPQPGSAQETRLDDDIMFSAIQSGMRSFALWPAGVVDSSDNVAEIVEPLQRLMVDEVDDDVSGESDSLVTASKARRHMD